MTLPNILTLSRILFAMVIIVLLKEGTFKGNILAMIVFAFASVTDFYDGYFAKKRGLISDFGKIMDPIADKILILSTFGVLAQTGIIAWWMFNVIAVREIAVTASRLMAMRQGHILAAERAGKVKTVVQIMAISAILLFLVAGQSPCCAAWFNHVRVIWLDFNYMLMLAAVLLTIYSGIEYFKNNEKSLG